MRSREVMLALRNRDMHLAYEDVEQQLEFLIMATPAGEIREELTQANIHFQLAKKAHQEKNNG